MISAILLAAGQSKRMKGKNKLREKIRGIPLIKRSVKNILDNVKIIELMKNEIKKIAKPNAADIIASEVLRA